MSHYATTEQPRSQREAYPRKTVQKLAERVVLTKCSAQIDQRQNTDNDHADLNPRPAFKCRRHEMGVLDARTEQVPKPNATGSGHRSLRVVLMPKPRGPQPWKFPTWASHPKIPSYSLYCIISTSTSVSMLYIYIYIYVSATLYQYPLRRTPLRGFCPTSLTRLLKRPVRRDNCLGRHQPHCCKEDKVQARIADPQNHEHGCQLVFCALT